MLFRSEDSKDVDLTIRLAGEAEQATIIDDDEIELELRALVQEAEMEKLAEKGRVALEDSKRLEGRFGEMKAPTDVPGVYGEPEKAVSEVEGIHA